LVQIAGIQGGMEYKLFGAGGPCGKCWCCKREVSKHIPWTCHFDEDWQKSDIGWCTNIEQLHCREVRWFGFEKSPCGGCGCCIREVP